MYFNVCVCVCGWLSTFNYEQLTDPVLVIQERKADDFLEFQQWLEKNGPFGLVIDGANLALFGQNFTEGGFHFSQIEAALKHSHEQHPDLKPLLVRFDMYLGNSGIK